MDPVVQTAIISGLCVAIPSVIATFSANKNNRTLLEYRIKELEKKMDKHNSVIERVYILEEEVADLKRRAN